MALLAFVLENNVKEETELLEAIHQFGVHGYNSYGYSIFNYLNNFSRSFINIICSFIKTLPFKHGKRRLWWPCIDSFKNDETDIYIASKLLEHDHNGMYVRYFQEIVLYKDGFIYTYRKTLFDEFHKWSKSKKDKVCVFQSYYMEIDR